MSKSTAYDDQRRTGPLDDAERYVVRRLLDAWPAPMALQQALRRGTFVPSMPASEVNDLRSALRLGAEALAFLEHALDNATEFAREQSANIERLLAARDHDGVIDQVEALLRMATNHVPRATVVLTAGTVALAKRGWVRLRGHGQALTLTARALDELGSANTSNRVTQLSPEERVVLGKFWNAWPEERIHILAEICADSYRPSRELVFANTVEEVLSVGREICAFMRRCMPDGAEEAEGLWRLLETLRLAGDELALRGAVGKAEAIVSSYRSEGRRQFDEGFASLNARGWVRIRDDVWLELTERALRDMAVLARDQEH